MIHHSVAFRLKHAAGSPEEKDLLATAQGLSEISTVQNFECRRQVSPKHDFKFGRSMDFEDQAAYDAYSTHPNHVGFVQNRWIPEGTDFMEIDYVRYT